MPAAGHRRSRSAGRTVLTLLVVGAVVAVVVGVFAMSGRSGDGSDDAREAADTTTPTPSSPSSPEPTEKTIPQAPPPQVGDCRDLAWADTEGAVTDSGAEPLPCGQDHTAQTVATGELAEGLDPDVDPDDVADSVSRECRSAVVQWLGGGEDDYELSMFAYVVAVPSADDLAAGARWWRCDTYATARAEELRDLPVTTEELLAGDRADIWATCVEGDLGAGQEQVLCSGPHDWRAISAHRLGDRADEFPGLAEVRDQTQEQCLDDVRAYVNDPLTSFDYGWLLPTRDDWTRGQRFVLCFAETSD